MPALLCMDRRTEVPAAVAAGEDLWLPLDSLEAASGWVLKPEGVCLDELCVPLPDRGTEPWTGELGFNLTALWRHLGGAVVRDAAGSAWSLGEPPVVWDVTQAAGLAPDFRLPDLEGRPHALSEQRGKKVLLLAWASW